MGALAAATGAASARAVLTALRDPYLVVDAEGRIAEVDDRLCDLTGYARAELAGAARPFPFWPTEEHAGGSGSEMIFAHRTGEPIPVRVEVIPVEGWVEPGALATLIVARDLRERERLMEGHRAARLESWDYLPDEDRFEGIGFLSGMIGVPPGSYSLAAVANFLDDASRRALRARIGAVLDGTQVETTVEVRLEDAPSGVEWVETRMRAVHDAEGEVLRIRGTSQDVTARRRAEQARERTRERLARQDLIDHRRGEGRIHLQGRLLDAIGAAVVATDLDGVVTSWNAACEHWSGWSREEAIGRPVAELGLWPPDAPTLDELTALVVEQGEWSGQLGVRRRDGQTVPAQVRTSLLHDVDGRPAGVVTVGVDVSRQVQAEGELRAARDYLRAVTDSMAEGVLTLDPDGRVITINRVGEQLLGWSQADLDGSVTWDSIASEPEGGLLHRDGSTLPVDSTTTPLETAQGVRGSVVVFSDARARRAREERMHRESLSWAWVQRIRDALAEDRFVLHAQPIIDIETGCVIGNELLIRMHAPDGTLVPPGEFLPAAEEHGLIVEIDRWVAGQALELAAAGHPVELNLSAHSISSPGLVDHFRRELERTGADPSLVVLELTETALMADEDTAERFIEQIGALGFMLALDDFGTGYGGFSYLKRMKVDFLKIDREFVCDLATNPASRHVVRAVSDLARGFGQQTVAEGVEDQETLEMLAELGVDFAQGYGIARPRPAGEVLGAAPRVDSRDPRST